MYALIIIVASVLLSFSFITWLRYVKCKKEVDNKVIVYINGQHSDSKIYHKSSKAHNMMDRAVAIDLAQAKVRGYVPCKKCFK